MPRSRRGVGALFPSTLAIHLHPQNSTRHRILSMVNIPPKCGKLATCGASTCPVVSPWSSRSINPGSQNADSRPPYPVTKS
ncbi:hypothetical protein Mp_3g13000 [Marchantia polymorpha subsp. ruderalis]|uniref:Uncharacterized protein n=2 Tax=Marchantia polymorpha TaxID=3197 RepID=A0AAF6B091_MARPO|nr:hypothetical protein MARPO_0050s0092 [Marchantia polymorpha]BBN05425.1 hypothetical protein Mp_3g13000 [Marchantia polymorpha subsp. ruderalis]|eukprot:PTQ38638.1 hypothetical protein MARPO_0050s0092 [Marchantia polymorpha]